MLSLPSTMHVSLRKFQLEMLQYVFFGCSRIQHISWIFRTAYSAIREEMLSLPSTMHVSLRKFQLEMLQYVFFGCSRIQHISWIFRTAYSAIREEMLSLPSTMHVSLRIFQPKMLQYAFFGCSRIQHISWIFHSTTYSAIREEMLSLPSTMHVSLKIFQPKMLQYAFLDAPEFNIFHGYFTQHTLLSERRCCPSLAPCIHLWGIDLAMLLNIVSSSSSGSVMEMMCGCINLLLELSGGAAVRILTRWLHHTHLLPLHSLYITLMLLVANLANTKWCKTQEKSLKPWHMGTHLRGLIECYQRFINIS